MTTARLALALPFALFLLAQGCSAPRGLDLGPPATFYGMPIGATFTASPMPEWAGPVPASLRSDTLAILDGADDVFAVVRKSDERVLYLFSAPPAGPGARRLDAVYQWYFHDFDARFIEGEEVGHVGAEWSLRRTTQPGLFLLWKGRGLPTAVVVGPDDILGSGVFPALEAGDPLPPRVRDGGFARDVARAKAERWSFARSLPLLQEIGTAVTSAAWVDADDFTEHTVNPFVMERESDWVNEVASAPVPRETLEATRRALLEIGTSRRRVRRSGAEEGVTVAWAAKIIADKVPDAWIETRKAAGRELAVASGLVRVKGKEGDARWHLEKADLMPHVHLASRTPGLAEEAQQPFGATLARRPCVAAVGATTYLPLEPITSVERASARRRIAVTIEETSTVAAAPAGEKLAWVWEDNPAWAAWAKAGRDHETAVASWKYAVQRAAEDAALYAPHTRVEQKSRRVVSTDVYVDAQGNETARLSDVHYEPYTETIEDPGDPVRLEQARARRRALGDAPPPAPDRGPEPGTKVMVQRTRMHWTYTGGIRWRVSYEGYPAATHEVALDVPATMDPIAGEAAARSALRTQAAESAARKLVPLLLPDARKRLASWVARFQDAAVRAEEERCGRAFLGD